MRGDFELKFIIVIFFYKSQLENTSPSVSSFPRDATPKIERRYLRGQNFELQ